MRAKEPGEGGERVVLALETSLEIVSCAVTQGRRLLSQVQIDSYQDLISRLPSLILNAVEMAGTTLEGIRLIAASLGPGSFTSLRTGLSVAKGLATGLRCPLVGVPTMDAMVTTLRTPSPSSLVVLYPSRPSRPLEVYFAVFRTEGGTVRKVRNESCTELPVLFDLLVEIPLEPVYFVGHLSDVQHDYIQSRSGIASAPFIAVRPNAWQVALSALDRLEREGVTDEVEAAVPIYVLPAPPG